jgi:glutamate/tyrosine decarboxylase-like PLP-dependent enzyme
MVMWPQTRGDRRGGVSEDDRQTPSSERVGDDPLAIGAADMRALGYWVVDCVVEHLERLPDEPAIVTATPAELAARLGGPPPLDGGDPLAAMETIVTVALAAMQHGDHPRYFARVPGPSSYPGVLGDWLATGFNAIASSWVGGSGVSAVELVALDWLRALLGLPEGAEGLMTSGGSLANLTALAAARAAAGPGVCYLSDQAHASVVRALSVLGFATGDVRVLPTGADLRLSPADLSAAVAADRSAGRRPGFVVATAGTTNTGAVDPLEELAGLCRAEGLWLHVDGAYGAAAALCDEGRRHLGGLGLADSVVVDPHKWLFQPYDLGCVFVRSPGVLASAFRMTPEYLADATGGGEVDLRDRGPELTRRGRALKMWLTFKVYGTRRLAAAVARGIENAEHAQRLIETDPGWRVVTPAQLGIVTFAPLEAGDDTCRALAERVAREGVAALTSTRLHGRPVLRLCAINPRTTPADVALTLAALGVRV